MMKQMHLKAKKRREEQRFKSARHTALRRISVMMLALVLMSTLCSAISLPVSAATSVRVTVNGKAVTSGKARIVDSTTYVPFRAFCNEVVSGSTVTWKASTKTATMTSGSTTVIAAVGKSYVTANGAKIYASAKNRLIGGTLYVPIRPMATALGYSVSWNANTYTATLTKSGSSSGSSSSNGSSSSGSSSSGSSSGSASYSDTDLYWLSRIIQAEAGGESYKGKLAVGTVIMNRVASSSYPNSVYGVIFDKRHGIQFTPAYNGKIYTTPSTSSVNAAKEVLNGYRIAGNIQYFLNPSIASDKWFRNNLTYICTIGNHAFYAP